MQSNPESNQISQSILQQAESRSSKVYAEFYNMLPIRSGQTRRRLHDNLSFPNHIRTTDWEMEIYLEEVYNDGPKMLRHLCYSMPNGKTDLHVVSEPVKIFSKEKTISSTLNRQTSWIISEEDKNLFIRAVDRPAIIAVEYRRTPKDNYNPKLWKEDGHLEDAVYTPSEEDYNHRKSFIRKLLDKNDLRQYLLFMDAEFSCKMADKSKAPVSITILNGEGKIVLDTLITPRHRIEQLGTKIHGITERQLRRQLDEYDILKRIRELCKGKILVGHDLQMELNHLCIDKKSILGIRDLATAKALEKWNIYPNGEGEFYKLKTIASTLLGREIQQPGKHNSKEDVLAVYDIYKKIEEDFVDDFNPSTSSVSIPITTNQLQKANENVGWKDPIENILQAWDREEVDIDGNTLEIEFIGLETVMQNKNDGPCSSASLYGVFDEILKDNGSMTLMQALPNRKRKLTIAKINPVDIPPGNGIEYVAEEIFVNGETYSRDTQEIVYKSSDGRSIIWNFKKQ